MGIIIIPLLLALAASAVQASTTVEYEEFNGIQRSYAMTTPDGCDSQGTVVALHGLGGSHAMLWTHGLDVQAQDHCRAVIAPDSLGNTWDFNIDGADVPWLESLLDRQQQPIAFIGFSAGSAMAQIMHWCQGYGDQMVLSAVSTRYDIQEACAPFDGGNVLLVMGWEDRLWPASDVRPSFRDFVATVAEDSGCSRSVKRQEEDADGTVWYRHYYGCHVDTIVPMYLPHLWWDPLAEHGFSWMFSGPIQP